MESMLYIESPDAVPRGWGCLTWIRRHLAACLLACNIVPLVALAYIYYDRHIRPCRCGMV
jgi:hypothetical protein